MIKFIKGGAQSDVSARMREILCEMLSQNFRKLFLVVPDQFELETEKTIYADLKQKGLLTELCRIHATTFSSLSRDILEQSGEKTPPADNVVKAVIMNKAVREQKNMLTALSGAADKAGFCERMVQTVSTLKTAGLTPSDFDNSFLQEENRSDAKRGMNTLVRKLNDVWKIFASYDSMLSKYADSLDYTKKAAELISHADNDYFADSCVFIDCFNDFTGSQLEFIRRMMPKAKNMVFAVVSDEKSTRARLFDRINAQIDRIIGYAKDEEIEVETESENLPARLCEPLSELSQNLFGKGVSKALPGGVCELVSASDVYEEADYTAAKIKQLCTENGFLYREIAVLCADAECGKYIRDAFEKYEIPFFLDIPEPILYQPLVNFFISLLNTLRNFTAENVLSCLKTGFYRKPCDNENDYTAISNKDIDVFENYIFEWNLSAKHLKKEFCFSGENDLNQAEAEAIRKAVVIPILKLRDRLKAQDGAGITRILYDFAANEVRIDRALQARCYSENDESGKSAIDSEAVRINQQIWNSLVEILEVLETELAGENISLDEYYRLFADICVNTTLAKPPQYRDCVLVGDIDRTRANGIKAAFIVGASYERLPSLKTGMGIFSDYETELVNDLLRRNLLNKNTVEDEIRAQSLKSFSEQYCLSLYRAYRAVSLPSEFLSLSCPKFDPSGNSVSCSSLFGDISRIFPSIEVIKAEDLGDEFYCRSLKAVKHRYAAGLGKNTKVNGILRGYLELKNCGDFVSKLDEIRENNKNSEKAANHILSENAAKQLFRVSFENRKNDSLSLGATLVESANVCPFSFFCSKELGIREIVKREFSSSNRGTAMHFVMQMVFEEYRDKMDEFLALGREDFAVLANKYLEIFIKENTNGDFEEDKRTGFLFRNLASSAADLLITMQTELSVKDYQPQFFELNISKENSGEIRLDTGDFNGNIPEKTTENTAENNIENNESGNLSENNRTEKFNLYTKPLSVKLSDGTEILIGGKVDRLDVMYAEKSGEPCLYLRVVDYKTKTKAFDKENAKQGLHIQMILYLMALCSANSENPQITVLPGEISYIPSKTAEASKTRLEELYLLQMNHHPSGLFIKDEIIENHLRRIVQKVSEQVNINNEKEISDSIDKTFVLDDENSVIPAEFEELCEEILTTVKNNLEQIYIGEVRAEPHTFSEKKQGSSKDNNKDNPCRYCSFAGICGNALQEQ